MIELLRERRKAYGATSALEEEKAAREMLQEVALYALFRRPGFYAQIA